ncbi:K(+)-transporting ATPase subunit F [Bordetella genomosp. 13]|nr:K(+)-transporting ATPase subunit F [Bordetella genomosp. 13]
MFGHPMNKSRRISGFWTEQASQPRDVRRREGRTELVRMTPLHGFYTGPSKLYPVFTPGSVICAGSGGKPADAVQFGARPRGEKHGCPVPRGLRRDGRPDLGVDRLLRARAARRQEGIAMTAIYWLGGITAAALLAYLLAALFNPEKF